MIGRLRVLGVLGALLFVATLNAVTHTRAATPPLPSVTVTGVATGANSAMIDFQPVPGARDYRVVDTANPTVVKYAGLVHLDAGVGGHFTLQADGITPVFPYTSTVTARGGTGPQTLDVPATEIQWDYLQDGQPHTLVVQAVDALGPVPPHNLTDVANTPLNPPADRPGANEGPTTDGHVSINGQGDSANTPQVVAQSGAFVVQSTPGPLPVPSRADATQSFLDTFNNAEAAALTAVGAPVNAWDSANAMTYTLNAGTPKAWDVLFQGVDTALTRPAIVDGHYQDTLFDGQTTATLTRFTQPFSHTLYASASLSPQTSADISGGKILHLTAEVDRHLDQVSRWLSFELAPATDPLTTFRADDALFGGNTNANVTAVNASNHVLWVQVIAGSCDATLLEGPRSTTDHRPLAKTFVSFYPATLTYPQCYQPMHWGDNGRGLDNRSRLDLFVTTQHLALFEDGVLLTQADLPDGGLPFSQAKVYFTHYLFNTAGESRQLQRAAPYETYWLNSFPHSDERHRDNVGFEVLPAAAAPATNDFSSLAALIHLPALTAPAFVIPLAPTPTPVPSVTSTPLPSNVPAAYSSQYASIMAGLTIFKGKLDAQPSPQGNTPVFGAGLALGLARKQSE